jgi:hypothetical protein
MARYDEIGRAAAERRRPEPGEASLGEDIGRWLEAAPRSGLQVIGPPMPPIYEQGSQIAPYRAPAGAA